MQNTTSPLRPILTALCLWGLLCCGMTAPATAAEEQSITGVVQGIINYGDAYGYAVQDEQMRVVTVVMGNGDLREFANLNIGSVIQLRYTTMNFDPEPNDVWPHKTTLLFYVPDSGRLLKKGPPNPWDEVN